MRQQSHLMAPSPKFTSDEGTIHFERTQNSPKKKKFLPPDTQTYVCVSQNKKHFFGGILRTYYMNDPEASS